MLTSYTKWEREDDKELQSITECIHTSTPNFIKTAFKNVFCFHVSLIKTDIMSQGQQNLAQLGTMQPILHTGI
jgi:hypothetical protein